MSANETTPATLSEKITCQCGRILGERCATEAFDWTDAVAVYWIPESLRATARAAATNRGVSEVLVLHPDCYSIISESLELDAEMKGRDEAPGLEDGGIEEASKADAAKAIREAREEAAE